MCFTIFSHTCVFLSSLHLTFSRGNRRFAERFCEEWGKVLRCQSHWDRVLGWKGSGQRWGHTNQARNWGETVYVIWVLLLCPIRDSGLLSGGGSCGYSLLPRQHCMCGRNGWTQSKSCLLLQVKAEWSEGLLAATSLLFFITFSSAQLPSPSLNRLSSALCQAVYPAILRWQICILCSDLNLQPAVSERLENCWSQQLKQKCRLVLQVLFNSKSLSLFC